MASPLQHLSRPGRILGTALRRHGAQMAITAAVFVVFVAVASGNLELLVAVEAGRSNLAAVASTPEFAMLAAVSLVLILALPMLAPIPASVLAFLCMLPVYWLGWRSTTRPLIPLEFSLLTILVLYASHVLVSWFREVHQKQQVINVFGQYVPPDLAQRLSRDPTAGSLEGEARELSVLFCDAKDFTRHAERLEPRELSALLNALLTPLTEVVHRHGGTIDKYLGDGMMAFWGAPLADARHAAHAVSAAFELQQAVARLAAPFAARGWPALAIGIGINTGVAHVGNMGSRYRMAYTAIGDVVNLAARLEALTRVFHCPIIVGEATRNAFPAAGYRELGLVRVKGKQELVRIFEPFHPAMDPASTTVNRLARHQRALGAYYARDWDRAEQAFRALHEASPEDPLYVWYLDRVQEFRAAPPPADWRGELRFTIS